jgi:hypothetical protein
MKLIIYNPATKLFDNFILALKYDFENLNIEVIDYNKFDLNVDLRNDDLKNIVIMIIVDPHFIFDYKDIEEEIHKISKKFKYKIIYITEPIHFIIEKIIYTNLIKMVNPYCLWTYTVENFNKLNIPRKIFKIFPENKIFRFINVTLDSLKKRNNSNIIFFGNINENRIDICKKFNKYIINETSSWTMEEWSNILSNYLFYLNIHRRNNCKSFESFRIIPILSNGGVIFSERCNSIEENLYKEYNIIFIDKKDLYSCFLDYIKNINYDEIYKKYNNYINDKKSDINNYFNYHNECSIKN